MFIFFGLDIVPIATRYPPENVQFEVQDVSSQLRWRTSSIDLVHARSISMAVHDYPMVLREVARLLRPGGLFISCEWGRYPSFHPSFVANPEMHTPGVHRFFRVLNGALDSLGIRPLASRIPALLEDSGFFTDITPQRFYMPIGPLRSDPVWKQEMGKAFRAALRRYAESVKPLLLESGLSSEEVEDIVQDYKHELKTIRGMVSELHTVWAHRI